jgi:hypothetical protein
MQLYFSVVFFHNDRLDIKIFVELTLELISASASNFFDGFLDFILHAGFFV